MSGLNPFFLVWWVTVGSLLLMTFLAQRLQEWIFIVLSVALLYFGGQFIVKGILLVT